jgi:RNA polymerase sigma-70 factor (ECF subfamily)
MRNTRENPDARDAFLEIYDETFRTVYGFIYARVGEAAAAEEILQETYAAAWASMGRFMEKSREATWILGIARHKIADHYRRAFRTARHEEALEDRDDPGSGEGPEDFVMRKETRQTVEKALKKLKPAYRYALAMKYLDGYSVKEIAKVFGKTQKSVDGILRRAKACFLSACRDLSKEDNDA